MNKFLTKIATFGLGMIMAIGVGVAAANSEFTKVSAGGDSPYSYTFTSTQFSANGTKTLNNVSWTLAGNGGYWGYDGTKGQQFGSGSKPYKSMTLSTSDIEGRINKIQINTSGASSINGSFTVSVGGTQYGSSTKLTTSATTYTFDGSAEGEIKFSYTQTSSKAIYIKSISITYDAAPAEELTGLRIASGENSLCKFYEAGEKFDATGLVVYASWNRTEDTATNVLGDISWNNNAVLSAGSDKTITGYHSSDTNKQFPITITGVDVVSPESADLNYSLNTYSLFEGDKYDADNEKTYNPGTGPTIQHLGGYIYQSNSMSLYKNKGMYFGNIEPFAKHIKKIVIEYTDNNSVKEKLQMHEGPTMLSEATVVPQSANSSSSKLVYNFSDENQYFILKTVAEGSYLNITSMRVYLGSAPAAATVTSVEISPVETLFVGKQIQLTATVHYTNKEDDNKVVWAIKEGDSVEITDGGLVTAVSTETTIVTATSVEFDALGNNVISEISITPLENPITNVEFDTTSAKKEYYVGEELDISGVKATGTTLAGDTVTITLTKDNFEGFDSTAAVNNQIITVTYQTFNTTYTINIVGAPNIIIDETDFSKDSYAANDGLRDIDNTPFQIKSSYSHDGTIQMRKSEGYFYNATALGTNIYKIEISVATGDITLTYGSEMNPSSNQINISATDGVETIAPQNATYFKITASTSGVCNINYIKIWFEGEIVKPEIETITLSQTSVVLEEGETLQLTATAEPLGCEYELTWESDKHDVATVTDGLITILKGGYTVTITAIVVDKDISAICVVKTKLPDILEKDEEISTGESILEGTLTFDDTSTRTELSTSKQVWQENNITLTNNKKSSSTNVADYSNPARFYKDSEIIINAPGNIKSITFNSSGESKYKTPLTDSLDGEQVNGNAITILLDGSKSSYTFNASGGQIRLYSIVVSYVSESGGSVVTDEEAVAWNDLKEFIDTHMQLDNIDLDDDGTGACREGFAEIVRIYNEELSDTAKSILNTSTHSRIVAAKERLESWARVNGYTLDGNQITQPLHYAILGLDTSNPESITLLIVSVLIALSTVAFIYFRKREQDAR